VSILVTLTVFDLLLLNADAGSGNVASITLEVQSHNTVSVAAPIVISTVVVTIRTPSFKSWTSAIKPGNTVSILSRRISWSLSICITSRSVVFAAKALLPLLN